MKGFQRWSFLVALMAAVSAGILLTSNHPTQVSAGEPEKIAPKNLKIDLSKAIEVMLPQPKEGLKPAAFQTSDGKAGWVVQIPGGRPIATPAYADGMLFVGGGYGSHEF